MDVSTKEIEKIVQQALAEDIGVGDVTSLSLADQNVQSQGFIISRGDYVLSGLQVAEIVFKCLDPNLTVEFLGNDGQKIKPDEKVMKISGSARSILIAERTALNFMQRMTGIASLTNQFVELVSDHKAVILDTRKTTPNLRVLEKYAVACGGGTNHRMGLYDRAMIKDNHRKLWTGSNDKSLAAAVRQVRSTFPDVMVEVEVENLAELADALEGEPEWVLLDNMTPDLLRQCVKLCDNRSKLEASGNVSLKNVSEVAATGVDAISIGCLTHSAPSADLSLELEI